VTVDQLPDTGTLQLSPGTSTIYEEALEDDKNENSCILSYYQYGLVNDNIREYLCHRVALNFMA